MGKFMKSPWPGRLIEAAAIIGISSWVGVQTSESYTPGQSNKGTDLNKNTAEDQYKAEVARPLATPTAKATELAKKIEEERRLLAAKKADQDVRHEQAGARLDELLQADKRTESSLSTSERKAALQNDIAARAKAYTDPKSQESLSAAGPRKQEGSFWGGAAVTALGLLSVSFLFRKITGRTLGGLIYPQSQKQTAHDHFDEQLKLFDEQFKAHQALTKRPHTEENQKAAAQADFNGQAVQSADSSAAQPAESAHEVDLSAASSEVKRLDALRAQASLKDKGIQHGRS